MAKGQGRPSVEIDKEQFEKLCAMQCTSKEIAGYFSCSHDTIERWVKKTYGMTFSEIFDEKRVGGLISLRRSQFRLAESNAAVAIWLGKQLLGQKDVLTFNNLDDGEEDPLTKSIKASLHKDKGSKE